MIPTSQPTGQPTSQPTGQPTCRPSLIPTSYQSSLSPTFGKKELFTVSPTFEPSFSPSVSPTPGPTVSQGSVCIIVSMPSNISFSTPEDLYVLLQAISLTLNVTESSIVIGPADQLCLTQIGYTKSPNPGSRSLKSLLPDFPLLSPSPRTLDPSAQQLSIESKNSKNIMETKAETPLSFSINRQISGKCTLI